MDPRLAKHPIVRAAVFLLYVAAGRFALHFAFLNPSASAFWPPAGIALAAVVIFGRDIWPVIAVASLAVNVMTTGNLWSSSLIAGANTIEALIAGSLVTRFADGRKAFQTVGSSLRVAAITGLVSTTFSATLGVSALGLFGLAKWAEFPSVWMTWWLGNLTGDLVFAPFILVWTAEPLLANWRSFRWLEAVEAVFLLVTLVGISLVVFGGFYPSDIKTYPLEFLCGPWLLWAAFRFGRREVVTAIVILSSIAVWGTLHEVGPFVHGTASESLMILQIYTSVTAIMSIVVAAVVSERRAALGRLHDQATTDPLTALANYRHLMDVLRTEISRSDRTGRDFAVLFMDVNGLKQINDRYGHLTGSRVLCQIADVLRQSCRTTDTPARFGGDEFAVVLAETGREGAAHVLRRIAERLAALKENPSPSVTGGIAVYPADGGTPAALLGFADQALYKLKPKKPTRRPREASGGRSGAPAAAQASAPDLFSNV
jgi:diguanylate cyclase (GGDEF)-like protein